MDIDNQLQIVIVWINIVNVIQSIIDSLDQRIRRWWTKPDITEQQRLQYGAFSTIFAYMKNNDHEKLYDCIGMSLEQFDYLYALVGNKLEKRSRRTPLPAELRLIATLYYLRNGGSVKMCASVFRIGTSTMYSILSEVCRTLHETLSPIYIPLPSANEWRIIANGFKDKWNFPNCLGAVDGRHFDIETPPNSGSFFFNYKKFSSVVLMAACDSFLRFTWLNVGDYGSLNDASIFNKSDLGEALQNQNIDLPPNERLPSTNISIPYFFIGDGGFGLKNYFITPFTRLNNLSIEQRVFNYRLSRARRTIESAFGLLVNKWKIFKSSLAWKLQNIDTMICACACLHNFLISCQIQNGDMRYADNVYEDQGRRNIEEYMNENVEIDAPHLNGVRLRDTLKEYFASPLGSVPWQWDKL